VISFHTSSSMVWSCFMAPTTGRQGVGGKATASSSLEEQCSSK
jgi:hypothetical protein